MAVMVRRDNIDDGQNHSYSTGNTFLYIGKGIEIDIKQ